MVTGEYSELEWKVRELTNSDPWGCSPTDMQNFLDELHTRDERHEVLLALQKRLREGVTWHNRYKSLNLLDHILKHGSQHFLSMIQDQQSDWLEILNDLKETYEFVDEKGKDQGINVRVKAKSIVELMQDPELLERTRKEEQERRNLMMKRRQDFRQNETIKNAGRNDESCSTSSFNDSVESFKPPKENYQELRGSPSLASKTPTPLATFSPANVQDDEFDDFQSAESSTAVSPTEKPAAPKPADPFSDLINF